MNNTYKKYIDEFMPSDEMRNYLKTQELTPYQIASLIFNSPHSIDQKKNAFYSLLSETDDSELKALCSNCIENIEKAYELLNTGGTFKVTSSFVNGVVELNDEGLFSKLGFSVDSSGSLDSSTVTAGQNAVVNINGVTVERANNDFTYNGLTISLKSTTGSYEQNADGSFAFKIRAD